MNYSALVYVIDTENYSAFCVCVRVEVVEEVEGWANESGVAVKAIDDPSQVTVCYACSD